LVVAVGELTSSHSLPLLEIWDWPPQMSTQVFVLASHQLERSVAFTEPAPTAQQGMGVPNVWFWAEAKPAKAEAATMREE
jgi:hypothetical protein